MKCADIPDRDVLLAIARRRITRRLITECFPAVPINLLMAKLRKLERRGLIECGVSLNSSMLTSEGRSILAEAGFTEESAPASFTADDVRRMLYALPKRVVESCTFPLHPDVSPEDAEAAGLTIVHVPVFRARLLGGGFRLAAGTEPHVSMRGKR